MSVLEEVRKLWAKPARRPSWASTRYLAEKTGLTVAEVRREANRLVREGYLVKINASGLALYRPANEEGER